MFSNIFLENNEKKISLVKIFENNKQSGNFKLKSLKEMNTIDVFSIQIAHYILKYPISLFFSSFLAF